MYSGNSHGHDVEALRYLDLLFQILVALLLVQKNMNQENKPRVGVGVIISRGDKVLLGL